MGNFLLKSKVAWCQLNGQKLYCTFVITANPFHIDVLWGVMCIVQMSPLTAIVITTLYPDTYITYQLCTKWQVGTSVFAVDCYTQFLRNWPIAHLQLHVHACNTQFKRPNLTSPPWNSLCLVRCAGMTRFNNLQNNLAYWEDRTVPQESSKNGV